MHDPSGLSEEHFGLRCPPPSVHLKRILANYPEGTSIFKEALQNADDAGATKFKLILDHRRIVNFEPSFERFAGCALLIYNNGTFSAADWMSFQQMFESYKAHDALSIGKYGMGSRSFFHMADILMILSGDQYAYLDPDYILSTKGGEKVPFCQRELLKASSTRVCTHLKGFHHVEGFDQLTQPFNGTIFRLPLRIGRYARESRFAPYEYTATKVLKILKAFAQELRECLLFLNSVQSIEVLEWQDCEDEPSLLASCFVQAAPATPALAKSLAVCGAAPQWRERRRSAIRGQIAEALERGSDLKAAITSASVIREVQVLAIHHEPEPMSGDAGQASLWLVGNCLVQDDEELLAVVDTVGRPPIIGIALLVCPLPTGQLPSAFSDDSVSTGVSQLFDRSCWPQSGIRGQLFSFLPIVDAPSTGLPFHFHGTFCLTDNRRDVWLSEEAEGLAKKWSQWNRVLLLDHGPRLLADLLGYCSNQVCFGNWPDPDVLSAGMKQFAINLAKCVLWNGAASGGFRGGLDSNGALASNRGLVSSRGPASSGGLASSPGLASDSGPALRPRPGSAGIESSGDYSALRGEIVGFGGAVGLGGSTGLAGFESWNDGDSVSTAPTVTGGTVVHLIGQGVRFLRMNDVTMSALNELQLTWHHVLRQVLGPASADQEIVVGTAGGTPSSIGRGVGLPCIRDMIETFCDRLSDLSGERIIAVPDRVMKSFCAVDSQLRFISFLTAMHNYVIPHWLNNRGINQLYYEEKYYVCWQYILCRTLSKCSADETQRFSGLCSDLRFIPCRTKTKTFTGAVMSDEITNDTLENPVISSAPDNLPLCLPIFGHAPQNSWHLTSPLKAYDTGLKSFKITNDHIPSGVFSTPAVSRVLKTWGMKQTLSWSDMTQEIVFRMCNTDNLTLIP
ncbi:hypothetical protein GNI_071940 [Gregarina niphandrodes]|uniref:Sacsin/Nov domain-containing protein n=1 Tax=Gregarina niphandrodes TaxID=110365 RepID=A0A023B786_GRENI|nr:hypothetical protein GNI_071940 [Gregarina niphandrodes]EZG67082.1 hypothetical protein GNI_071940 [Gregarina niphandrodes]|eukprot:XP_011130336.1 hypothetical protein GNI_071940 [Gregarina niphandrodes]